MSILYTAIPFDEDFFHKEVLNWLEDYQVEIPTNAKTGRYPTPHEMKKVLDSFTDYNVEYPTDKLSWQAEVRGENARVSINIPILGDENSPNGLGFTGNRELITHLTQNAVN